MVNLFFLLSFHKKQKKMIKLVIFDLDGTLLNTISDLAGSTNYALKQCGFPEHETDAYNYFVGNGINKLFERALPENARTPENIGRMRGFFFRTLYPKQYMLDSSLSGHFRTIKRIAT